MPTFARVSAFGLVFTFIRGVNIPGLEPNEEYNLPSLIEGGMLSNLLKHSKSYVLHRSKVSWCPHSISSSKDAPAHRINGCNFVLVHRIFELGRILVIPVLQSQHSACSFETKLYHNCTLALFFSELS